MYFFRWIYIKHLHRLQQSEGLHAGNRLSKDHVQWKKQPMKVKLAVQVLSRSVSDAIDFCRDELKLPEFVGSEATCHFICLFDQLFDLLNSKNALGKSFKSPLRNANKQGWSRSFSEAFKYILNLKTLKGIPLVNSARKSGFLGFLCNIKYIESIFEKYVQNGPLKFLLTFKFSQDHLELFFGCLRTRFGCNNNPSAKEFKIAYKKLLLHQEIRGNRGNCITDNDTFFLSRPPSFNHEKTCDHLLLDSFNLIPVESDHDYSLLSNWPVLSQFQSSVIEYIAGYCVKMSLKLIKCSDCIKAVTENNTTGNYKLVNSKDRGGLIYVNSSVRIVCEMTESTIKKLFLVSPGFVPKIKNINAVVITNVLKHVVQKYD